MERSKWHHSVPRDLQAILAASEGREGYGRRVAAVMEQIEAGDTLEAKLGAIVDAETPKANSTVRRMARLAREAQEML